MYDKLTYPIAAAILILLKSGSDEVAIWINGHIVIFTESCAAELYAVCADTDEQYWFSLEYGWYGR